MCRAPKLAWALMGQAMRRLTVASSLRTSVNRRSEEYRLDQDETRTLKIATRDGYLVDAVVHTVNASKS